MYLIEFHDGLLLFSPIHSINDINTASTRHAKRFFKIASS